jgi:hypothetical protein
MSFFQKRPDIKRLQELIDQKFPPHLELQPKGLVAKKSLLRLLNRLIEEATEFFRLSNSSTENVGAFDDGPMSSLDEFSGFTYMSDDEAPSF